MAYAYRDSAEITFEWGGRDTYTGRFTKHIEGAAKQARDAAGVAGLMAAYSKAPKRSGALAESISLDYSKVGNVWTATVGPEVYYADFIRPHDIPNAFGRGHSYGFGSKGHRKNPGASGRGYPEFFHPGTGDAYIRAAERAMLATMNSELDRRL